MSSISASLVSQFVSFTGASAAEASMFLEMAGNNVEVAVGLFFGGGGGFGGGDSAAAAAGAAAGGGGGESEQPAFAKLCFGASCSAPPAAWLEQKIEFVAGGGGEYSQLGSVMTALLALTGFTMVLILSLFI